MKVGDKVICKKSIDYSNYVYKCNYEYNVEFFDNGIYIQTDDIIGFKFNSGRWFNVDKRTCYKHDFNEYFYTKREFRKKKLEKLNSLV